MKQAHQLIISVLALAALAGWFITAGCEGTGGSAGTNLFAPAGDTEKWTIRCCRIEEPDHVQKAESLAAMLRQVKQLNPKAVRVATDETGSSVYYGEYRRVASAKSSDQLVFPPEQQKDIAFIRSLSDGISTPFRAAQPEPVNTGEPSAHPEWEATNAPATHSLLVAVFYNTESFNQRKEIAEQYVGMLRAEGFPAYYYHEPVKSFVFVGDFSASDIIVTPEGNKPGPRVEQLIARREDEFRHFTENGHVRTFYEGMGKQVAPLTQVYPLPRKESQR